MRETRSLTFLHAKEEEEEVKEEKFSCLPFSRVHVPSYREKDEESLGARMSTLASVSR